MADKICVGDRLKKKIEKDYKVKPISKTNDKFCFNREQIKSKLEFVDGNSPFHFVFGLVFGIFFGIILIQLLTESSQYWLYSILGFFLAILTNLLIHGIRYREFNIRIAFHKNAVMDLLFTSAGFYFSMFLISYFV